MHGKGPTSKPTSAGRGYRATRPIVTQGGIDGVVAPRALPDPITVSIICPTYRRQNRHAALYKLFEAQTHPHCDLWVLDDGTPKPSPFFTKLGKKDPRVHYQHTPGRQCVGYKRNALVQKASGSVIVHFDDDDWYDRTYVEWMLARLVATDADLVKLGAWNTRRTKDGYRWTERSPGDPWGYGFSYVYRRHVATRVRFPDAYCWEDTMFVRALTSAGMKASLVTDGQGWAEHILHGGNTSRKE